MSAESVVLADLASLVADRTRASVCTALLDGRAWTSGELARYAGVAPSTMSEHVTRLIAGGLLVEERQGRHRYVRLAGHETAELLERLGCVAGPAPEPVGGLRRVRANEALRRGRTCYDHLAGRLGVTLTDALNRTGLLDQGTGFALTNAGLDWFVDGIGMPPPSARTRRPLARACLDWTERRPHLAGAAGAWMCDYLLDADVLTRSPASRAVRPTRTGADTLRDLFDLTDEEIGDIAGDAPRRRVDVHDRLPPGSGGPASRGGRGIGLRGLDQCEHV
ncbi:winged helix-turn-helix transcriptional regulator [Spiractinospora alimapuensis]|uniref:ArsR/SmtB family transcription factor n=1 Tax=Spiractinospora alimapuensis TaxID=2820884 RepID=UPI001F30D2CF|nr:winged helix-turn-helix domain-containing protein [Spiractinospora alimapuensis]QVQ51209.1 winged helix-turn-helix transcriptional regulator [Spiractinospora alimapuensis]